MVVQGPDQVEVGGHRAQPGLVPLGAVAQDAASVAISAQRGGERLLRVEAGTGAEAQRAEAAVARGPRRGDHRDPNVTRVSKNRAS